MASITKIMTFYVVWKLLERFNLSRDELVEVSANAASVIGSTAKLKKGDTLTIWQLLFALILPSGNDCATAIAEFFGTRLRNEAM